MCAYKPNLFERQCCTKFCHVLGHGRLSQKQNEHLFLPETVLNLLHGPVERVTRHGSFFQIKNGSSRGLAAVPVSPSPLNLLPASQMCLGVWLLSLDQCMLLRASGILMKYLKSQFAHFFSVLSKSLITAPQAEGT